jgi:hypothetical protein
MFRQEHPHRHRAGGEDELTRVAHRHYCGICGNDWSHDEDRCLDGRAASCPWCVPSPGAEAQGARTGPHFHDCPLCGSSWRHSTTCAEPFQASLPDCPACVDSHDDEPNRRTREPRVPHGGRAAYVRALVKPCALSFLLTAGLILAFQQTLKAWPTIWTTPQSTSVRLPEQPRAEAPPPSIRSEMPPRRKPSVAVAPRRERAQRSRPSPAPARPPASLSSPTVPSASPSALPSSSSSPSQSPSPSTPPPPPEPGIVVARPDETAPPRPVEARVAEPSVPGAPPAGVLGGGSSWETLSGDHPRSTERRARLNSRSRQ